MRDGTKAEHVLSLKHKTKLHVLKAHPGWAHRISDHYRNLALESVFAQGSGRVLDFGCGEKPYLHLLKQPQISEWIGVDLENRTSGLDKKNHADLFWSDKGIPVSNETFDIALATQVFEHIPNLDFAISEIARVLKHGGLLIATVPMTGMLHEEPHDYRRFTPYGMKMLAEQHGFTLERTIALGGIITLVSTLIATHLNFVRRVPVVGPILHNILAGMITQIGVWFEILFFKAGFEKALITLDYLFVLRRS